MTRTKRSSSAKPLYRTPDPIHVPGAWFDDYAVERVIKYMSKCRHTKGKWAGPPAQPIIPDDWQVDHFIAPVFGWKHPPTDLHPRGLRIRRTGWLEVPKKSGKSTLAQPLGLYLTSSDGEAGAEVYAAATDRDQARTVVFAPAIQMVERSPLLKKHLQPFVNTITHRKSGSFFRVISSVPKGKHGLNIHGAIIEEIHAHESRELIDTLDYGTAVREQPLMLYITTAGEDDDESIYAEKHDYVIQICQGIVDDPTFYGVIFAAEEDDDPFDERTWWKANPALGRTLSIEYLRSKATEAKSSPKKRKEFCQKHLNIRQGSTVVGMSLKVWDASKKPPAGEKDLLDRVCFGGLNVSRSMDIAAFVLDFPGEEEHEAVWRFWLPEDWREALSLETKGASEKWIEAGSLELTSGDVIDYDAIEEKILDDADRFDLREVAFNRRGARQLANRLEQNDIAMVKMAPGVTLAPAWQEFERVVLKKLYRHGGHPVMRSMIRALRLKIDAEGNAWPDQGRSKGNIAGPMAAVMALDCATRNVEEEPAELVSF